MLQSQVALILPVVNFLRRRKHLLLPFSDNVYSSAM